MKEKKKTSNPAGGESFKIKPKKHLRAHWYLLEAAFPKGKRFVRSTDRGIAAEAVKPPAWRKRGRIVTPMGRKHSARSHSAMERKKKDREMLDRDGIRNHWQDATTRARSTPRKLCSK